MIGVDRLDWTDMGSGVGGPRLLLGVFGAGATSREPLPGTGLVLGEVWCYAQGSGGASAAEPHRASFWPFQPCLAAVGILLAKAARSAFPPYLKPLSNPTSHLEHKSSIVKYKAPSRLPSMR